MATTLTSRGKQYLGPGMVLEYGDYSTDGSTTATVSVSGGYVVAIEFFDAAQNPLTTATSNTVTLSAKTGTNPVSYTLTPGGSAVTGGTYRIMHGGQ